MSRLPLVPSHREPIWNLYCVKSAKEQAINLPGVSECSVSLHGPRISTEDRDNVWKKKKKNQQPVVEEIPWAVGGFNNKKCLICFGAQTLLDLQLNGSDRYHHMLYWSHSVFISSFKTTNANNNSLIRMSEFSVEKLQSRNGTLRRNDSLCLMTFRGSVENGVDETLILKLGLTL